MRREKHHEAKESHDGHHPRIVEGQSGVHVSRWHPEREIGRKIESLVGEIRSQGVSSEEQE